MAGDGFYDREKVKANRFLGKINKFRITEGETKANQGIKVLSIEVEDVVNPRPWGAFTREIRPAYGSYQAWAKMLECMDKLKIQITQHSDWQKLEGKCLWFEETRRTYKKKETGEDKSITEIWPCAVPTDADVKEALSHREEAETAPSGDKTMDSDYIDLVLSLAPGKTEEEVAQEAYKIAGLSRDDCVTIIANLITDDKIEQKEGKFVAKEAK